MVLRLHRVIALGIISRQWIKFTSETIHKWRQNVGIITGNHELYDNRKHTTAPVHIGKYCWIGMGAIILPGVTLGDYSIVAAGSIVTKSYPDGYCVIGGNPARVLKTLDKEKCVFHKSEHEYNGYIPHLEFEDFRKKFLNV